MFLPGDWNEGACQAPRFVVRREGGGQAGEDLSLETASIDSIAQGTKWGWSKGQDDRKGPPLQGGRNWPPTAPRAPARGAPTRYGDGQQGARKGRPYHDTHS